MQRISTRAHKLLPLTVKGAASTSRRNLTEPGDFLDGDGDKVETASCIRCPGKPCMSRLYEGRKILTCPVGALNENALNGMMTISNGCIGCGACVFSCELGAIHLTDDGRANVNLLPDSSSAVESTDVEFGHWVKGLAKSRQLDIGEAKVSIERITDGLKGEKASVIYPLTATLFSLIGLPAVTSNPGDTSSRADVQIKTTHGVIPVEVKSFSEIDIINLKAVQQALENKLFTARQSQAYELNSLSSYAVGFNYPPDRTGILELVEDVYSAFGVSIALISMPKLLELAAQNTFGRDEVNAEQLWFAKGIV